MQDLKELEEQIKQGREFSYMFFWGHREKTLGVADKSCFSQWYPRGFRLDEVYYPTAEHYMMVEKARLFEPSRMEMVLNAKTTKEVKLLGRSIKNFDEKIWVEKSFDIVVKGNMAKFSQHEDLKAFLFSTGSKVIVEASLYDKVWGIGMLGDDKRALHPLEWNGLNKLGFVLMLVREKMLRDGG
jgi:ribA/ribD-fused uncharacterized protein